MNIEVLHENSKEICEKEKYEYKVYSRARNAKYINIYKEKTDCYELHITDEQDIDVYILIDKDDFNKVNTLFWTFCYTGCDKSSILIYTYVERNKKMLLKHLIMNNNSDNIIPLNRNQCDFRKCNLYIEKDVCRTPKRKQKSEKDLPNNIFCIKQKNGKITGYKTITQQENKLKFITFGIKKYKTLENCLKEAVQYLEKNSCSNNSLN